MKVLDKTTVIMGAEKNLNSAAVQYNQRTLKHMKAGVPIFQSTTEKSAVDRNYYPFY